MVKQKIIVDTNLIIDYLRLRQGKKSKILLEKLISKRNLIPIISVAVIQELFAGQSSKRKKEERRIKKVLNLFEKIPVNQKISELAGKIMRDTKPFIKFADASIAATTILEKAYLVTKNKKDFQNIKGLKIYQD